MPRIAILGLTFWTLFSITARPQDRPKLGLVLCGGGAKGMAHLGTLKLLDELHIPVDYVTGTSIGGIIGALYAIGYSGREIEFIAERVDWEDLLSDRPSRDSIPYLEKVDDGRFQFNFQLERFIPQTPSGLIYGQKISLLFSSLTFPYASIDDFDKLPIPFRCVAADLVSGRQIVLGEGSLAKAMRATMAIPSVFSPVDWEDKLLIDGGVLNNLPVDVARSMGADLILAVDLGGPLKPKEELGSADVILGQTINLVEMEQKKRNREDADVLIHPDMKGMGVMDFLDPEKMREIKRRGETAAREALPRLLELKRRMGLEEQPPETENLPRRVHSFQITGLTVTPFKTLYSEIGIRPGDRYDREKIENRLAELRTSFSFERLDHEAIPVKEDWVRLLIHVRDREKPVLARMVISGNQVLPADFIRRLLQYKSGDELETDELNRRIMSLYGLGYFENIRYDLTPLGNNQVELRIHMRELPRSRLRVGLHYDNYHRVVTTAAIHANNLIFPGLRLENEIQLGGRSRIMAKASYPSRAMNLPVYPFIQSGYRSYPAEIFGGEGTRLVSFHDRSWIFGAGIGLLFEKWFNAEFEYRMEWMDASPKVASTQDGITPSWKDDLRLLCGSMTMDTRDDVGLPREGFHLEARVEGSFKWLGSETPYRKLDVRASLYQTFSNRHTFCLMGYWAEADSGLPLYKSFNMGRPEYFVGMKYDQLAGRRMKIIRLDYRFRVNNFLHVEAAGNLALDVEQRLPSQINQAGRLWGVGAGILIDTPVGPLRLMTSTGSRGLLKPAKAQNQFFIVFGARF